MEVLTNKVVYVTGGSSMIGREIINSLNARKAKVVAPNSKQTNLLSNKAVYDDLLIHKPDYVIHAAGWNGGIKYNKEHPEEIFSNTVTMAMNVLYWACRIDGIKKAVSIIASCSYPDTSSDILNEETLWNGKPNDTVECHGLAKRMLDAYSRQISKEKNLTAVCAVLTNSYGPHDRYNLDRAKVVGALIRKFVEAKQNNVPQVDCWGTGAPLREFMYAPDAGESIVQVLERYDNPSSVINIGSGQEVSIKELSETIKELVGYEGEINWLTDKPDGQMRKMLDTTKMKELLNVDITDFRTGLRETIEWYIQNQDMANKK